MALILVCIAGSRFLSRMFIIRLEQRELGEREILLRYNCFVPLLPQTLAKLTAEILVFVLSVIIKEAIIYAVYLVFTVFIFISSPLLAST